MQILKVENERNCVAGYLSNEIVNINLMNDLDFVAYSLKRINDDGTIEHIEDSLNVLNQIGFNKKYKPVSERFKSIKDFQRIYDNFKKHRENSPFLIDGFVIKFPEKFRDQMGDNGHYYKWCVACKFPSEEAVTTILDVEWTLAKTGELMAVGLLKPVKLLDTMVSRVSLGGLGNILKNGTFPGTKVSLKKSGEIIPMITSVLEKSPDHDAYIKEYEDFLDNQ